MNRRQIDLNADLGEDPAGTEGDALLLALVTSANVACGGHAGDEVSMRALARLCLVHGVALGAHPAYPDRAGFGRRALTLSSSAIESAVFEQIAALAAVAREEGATLAHVKPHGALYHACSQQAEVATAVGRAARGLDPRLRLVAQAGSPALTLWRSMGLEVAAEAFVDRRYEPDGRLRTRLVAGALIESPEQAAEQAVRIALGRGALLEDGSVLPLAADTLCVHGDTPHALEIARAVHRALGAAGVSLRALETARPEQRPPS